MTDIVDEVMQQVGRHFEVSSDDIMSGRRTRQTVPARLVAVYLAQKVSGMSPRDLGSRFGGRDYTNILMYCRAIDRQAVQDDRLRQLLIELEAGIRDGQIP